MADVSRMGIVADLANELHRLDMVLIPRAWVQPDRLGEAIPVDRLVERGVMPAGGTVADAVAAVRSETGVPVRAITGPRRDRDIVRARLLVMWLLCRILGMTATEAGRAVRRDRTTVRWGLTQVAAQERDPAAAREIGALQDRILAEFHRLQDLREATQIGGAP